MRAPVTSIPTAAAVNKLAVSVNGTALFFWMSVIQYLSPFFSLRHTQMYKKLTSDQNSTVTHFLGHLKV